MKRRITVRICEDQEKKIEEVIKANYPSYKNFSDVIRAAIAIFSKDYECDKIKE